MRILMVVALLAGLAIPLGDATAQSDAQSGGGSQTRATQALANLKELIETREALQTERDTLRQQSGPDIDAAAQKTALEQITREIDDLTTQIGTIATGVSDADFRAGQGAAFDLNTEIQALVEPFVAMMRDATDNARQIERLRRSVAEARRRLSLARQARETLAPVRDAATDEALIATLDDMDALWQRRADAAEGQVNALEQQLKDRLSDRGESREAANAVASGFFKDRGLSLIYGIGAFIGVFVALRFVHKATVWLREKRRIKRSFATRLVNLIFTAFTFIIATGAMLAVFNARNDWLLLGIFGIMLLTLAWAGIRMIPGAMEQVTLLLNLGAVQEDERVLIDDVPYRVRKLDFYTDFENPALEGADYTLPVRALIGLHSRPSGPDEPWFPTRKNDWVRLNDETYGRIVSQSPEMVEIEIPGGSEVTYTTADFMAAQPENLRNGFRAEITFGIGYSHQAEATGEVMETLKAHVRSGLLRIIPATQLRTVGIAVLEAGDNAIIYEVEADLTGAAAPVLEDVERELTRLCIEACTVNNWDIPFPQMVVHRS
ncbi:MAG: hypothetical protein AAF367_09040 [Pseudomonadota bacterium]